MLIHFSRKTAGLPDFRQISFAPLTCFNNCVQLKVQYGILITEK